MKCSRWAVFALAATSLVLGGCGSSGLSFNATPIIQNIFPSSITAGSNGFTLFISGSGFISSSKGVSFAYWNGSPRSTTYNLTTNQLEVQIPASDVAAVNIATVTVVNPPPGGGSSLIGAPFTIEPVNPGDPEISSFMPASARPGDSAFTLKVNGVNFQPADVVIWNGGFRTTAFVNSGQVTAQITQVDVADAGLASVSVARSANPIIASLSVNFPIVGSNNPLPGVSSLSPSSAKAGASDLEVVVSGSGFASNAVAEWNNVPLATSYLSGSRLVALVPAADLVASGTAEIGVANPAPGGGTSTSTAKFTISQ